MTSRKLRSAVKLVWPSNNVTMPGDGMPDMVIELVGTIQFASTDFIL